MVSTGVDFWYDNYGLWPWQAKPRPQTTKGPAQKGMFSYMVSSVSRKRLPFKSISNTNLYFNNFYGFKAELSTAFWAVSGMLYLCQSSAYINHMMHVKVICTSYQITWYVDYQIAECSHRDTLRIRDKIFIKMKYIFLICLLLVVSIHNACKYYNNNNNNNNNVFIYRGLHIKYRQILI